MLSVSYTHLDVYKRQPFVEINESDVDTDYSDDFYDARYYIDLSSCLLYTSSLVT